MVEVPKSASSVRKHLVRALLQNAGRSMTHSADARAQVEHAAVVVLVSPVVRPDTGSVNLPYA